MISYINKKKVMRHREKVGWKRHGQSSALDLVFLFHFQKALPSTEVVNFSRFFPMIFLGFAV